MSAETPGVRAKLESLNPATGERLAQFEPAGEAEVRAAVARAREASRGWGQLSPRDRADTLRRLERVLYERREEIAALITREAGKPLVESLAAEVMLVLDTLEYFARRGPGWLAPQPVPHHNLALKLKKGRLVCEPYGVVGIISPSNYPFSIPWSELIPALVAGNTVILKPSELTPQIGLAIGELIQKAGLPEGVATVILGDGLTGRAIVSSGIDKLIFTGSVATGKKIQAAAAERLLPTLLELGGKDPMIVCADADLDYASSGAVWGAFTNAGQACLSVERVYAAREVAEEFTRLCVEKTRKLRVGPGDDPSTDVGPLIRDGQVSVVEEHVRDAVRQGAQVQTGGRRLKGPGFFYQPTVLTGVHHGMQIMREETFGPVLPIMTVQDDSEAVALANDSDLGLSASIWTRDRRRGERLAAQLQAGAVMINDCASYFGISEAPHGGVKQSGIGRTHSRLGLMEMVRVKYIDADLAAGFGKFWWFEYGPRALDLMRGFVDLLFARNLAGRVRGLGGVLPNLWKRGTEGRDARIRSQAKKSSHSES